ncbi:MAG: outer membrane beta-barrel protein [Bacteroidetes bacterium]|nr:outer membrane beta-barrel protein [Bacteroidota bacterium]
MNKKILILMLCWISLQLPAQNSIGIQAGFLGTHTSVSEYERINRNDFLLDSMSISSYVGSVQVVVNADIDLGKNVFLSTGFHYCKKGLSDVTFTDSRGGTWSAVATQQYVGLSLLLGYHFHFNQSRLGLHVATGPQADFAVGMPNGGALYSGTYSRFLMPFSRFNELDFSWRAEAGISYKLGPGDVIAKLSYLYGMSDVLEDAFVIGRSMSAGISVGYSFSLGKRD